MISATPPPQSTASRPHDLWSQRYQPSGYSSSELSLPTQFNMPVVSESMPPRRKRRPTSQPLGAIGLHDLAGHLVLQYPDRNHLGPSHHDPPSSSSSYEHIIDSLTQELDHTRRERDEFGATVAHQANELRVLKSTLNQLQQRISFISSRSNSAPAEIPTSLRSSKGTLFHKIRTPFGASKRSESVPTNFTTIPVDQDVDLKPPFAHVGPSSAISLIDPHKPASPRTAPSLLSLSDDCDTLTDTASFFTASNHSSPATIYSLDRNTKSPEIRVSNHGWFAEFSGQSQRLLKIDLARTIPHKKAVLSVKFSPDGKYLAAGCVNGTAYIYDVRTGEETSTLTDTSVEDVSVKLVCFNFDNTYLATAGSDHQIRIWIIAKRYTRNVFKGHEAAINATEFSANGRLVVSSSDDRTVRIWRMRDGFSRVLTAGHGIWSSHLHPNGRYVASGCNPRSLLIWDVRTGRLVQKWNGHKDPVDGVEFTPDGKGLVTASWDKTLKRWDVSYLGSHFGPEETARIQREIRQNGGKLGRNKVMTFNGHTDNISEVSISQCGRWVASASWDDTVRIWNLRNATMECILHGHKDVVWSVDFSPVGNLLATGGGDHQLTIWEYGSA